MFFCAWQGANCCRARYQLFAVLDFSGIAISRTVKSHLIQIISIRNSQHSLQTNECLYCVKID